MTEDPIIHGVNCPKVQHIGFGHGHGPDEMGRIELGDRTYCGRCHEWLDSKKKWNEPQ